MKHKPMYYADLAWGPNLKWSLPFAKGIAQIDRGQPHPDVCMEHHAWQPF